MVLVLIVLGVIGLGVVAVVLWHGASTATAEGSWPVIGWETEELRDLVEARHAHEEETDPNLERWALAELAAMEHAIAGHGDDTDLETHWRSAV